jgi:AcrR family transcriptional regulator
MTKSNSFHHGDLKRALIDVAVTLLDQHGVTGVTIRAVAREAGVSHSAPVNHYKDRRTLLTAIAQDQFEIILKDIEFSLLEAPNNQKDRIEVFANTMIEFGFRYPHRYQLLWRGDLIDHADPRLLAVMDSIYDQLCDEIERNMPEAKVDRDTIAVALWSMWHGYIDMRLSGMFLPLDDKVTGKPRHRAMLDLFLTVLR